MSLERFTELYLDYRNNFITVEAFAQHHGLSLATADSIVQIGRMIGALKEGI